MIYKTVQNQWQQLKSNFIQNQLHADRAGPGHWNDPDMLQIGNGLLTPEEEKTHFALWAFAKAPLIIGCDLETVSEDSLAVLMNKELIAINQDRRGEQVRCVSGCDFSSQTSVFQQLVLEDPNVLKMAVMVVNWHDTEEAEFNYNF